MGLYLQCDQEIPSKPKFHIAGQVCGHHDSALYGCVRQTANQDLPQTGRTCHGQDR